MRPTAASAVDELRAAFDEPFAALGSDTQRNDGTVVVISWPSVPVELIRAAGLTAVVARGRREPTPAADRVLENDLFPNRLRQLVEAALLGRLAEVAAIVLPRTSDPDYKCLLYLRELVRRGDIAALPPILLFDVLHSDGADAHAYNTERARAFSNLLASLAGRRPAEDDLRGEIASANRARAAARRLTALRAGAPRIAGVDALPLLGAFWQLEPARYVALAGTAADSLAGRATLEGTRVLLAGAPVDSAALHAAIEADGAVVVAELSPFGSAGTRTDVAATGDPFAALAEHYRRESIDARLPVGALMSKLDDALGGVAAVVISLPPDDASFGWDYPRMRERLARRSIGHAVLAGDPVLGATAADRQRLRALLRAVAERREAHGG